MSLPAKVKERNSNTPDLAGGQIKGEENEDDGLSDSEDQPKGPAEALDSKFTTLQLEYMDDRKDDYKELPKHQRREFAINVALHFLDGIREKVEREGRKIETGDRTGLINNVVLWFRIRCRKRLGAELWEKKWSKMLFEAHTKCQISMEDIDDGSLDLAESESESESDSESDSDSDSESESESDSEAQSESESESDSSDLDRKGRKPDGKDPKDGRRNGKSIELRTFSLNEEEVKEMQDTAANWNKEGPPPEVQRQLAFDRALPVVRQFIHNMYKSMGVRMAVLVGFEGPGKEPYSSFVDCGAELGKRRFVREYRSAIRDSGIFRNWSTFIQGEFEDNLADNLAGLPTPKLRGRGKPLLSLPLNSYMEPILPNPSVFPKGLPRWEYYPHLIRTFVTLHLALASGRDPDVSHPPWRILQSSIRDYVNEEYLPDDLSPYFVDPTKINVGAQEKLLYYWYRRQVDGEAMVFEFHHYPDSKGSPVVREPRKLQEEEEPDRELKEDSSVKQDEKERKSRVKNGKKKMGKGQVATKVEAPAGKKEGKAQVATKVGAPAGKKEEKAQVATKTGAPAGKKEGKAQVATKTGAPAGKKEGKAQVATKVKAPAGNRRAERISTRSAVLVEDAEKLGVPPEGLLGEEGVSSRPKPRKKVPNPSALLPQESHTPSDGPNPAVKASPPDITDPPVFQDPSESSHPTVRLVPAGSLLPQERKPAVSTNASDRTDPSVFERPSESSHPTVGLLPSGSTIPAGNGDGTTFLPFSALPPSPITPSSQPVATADTLLKWNSLPEDVRNMALQFAMNPAQVTPKQVLDNVPTESHPHPTPPAEILPPAVHVQVTPADAKHMPEATTSASRPESDVADRLPVKPKTKTKGKGKSKKKGVPEEDVPLSTSKEKGKEKSKKKNLTVEDMPLTTPSQRKERNDDLQKWGTTSQKRQRVPVKRYIPE
ncbi:hypothetical protein DFP72DRAFT_1074859 [Ephemerocybe angulata]|uniref:Uncharacterized protein n=1 Tax=Ephemerocybe angulata TaxID=980116 RepID=A0A8H6HLI6_9AGAR|nr:hypothetical protein DFP72DRAFT_1074859 [Tulosesus angulatus]